MTPEQLEQLRKEANARGHCMASGWERCVDVVCCCCIDCGEQIVVLLNESTGLPDLVYYDDTKTQCAYPYEG